MAAVLSNYGAGWLMLGKIWGGINNDLETRLEAFAYDGPLTPFLSKATLDTPVVPDKALNVIAPPEWTTTNVGPASYVRTSDQKKWVLTESGPPITLHGYYLWAYPADFIVYWYEAFPEPLLYVPGTEVDIELKYLFKPCTG